MATSSPVPSRAAINALRGVALTTSCSIVLLAEERRQRLKLARSALENAKKIHTLQAASASAVLSEGLAPRDVWLTDFGHDSSVDHAPSNPPRRRRRREERIRSISRSSVASETAESEASRLKDVEAFAAPRTSKQQWEKLDANRKEAAAAYVLKPISQKETFLRISNNGDSRVSSEQRLAWSQTAAAPLPVEPMAAMAIGQSNTHIPPEPVDTLEPEISQPAQNNATGSDAAPLALRQALLGESATNILQQTTEGQEADTSTKTRTGSKLGGIKVQYLVDTLDNKLRELERPCADPASKLGSLDSAIESLFTLTSTRAIAPQKSLKRSTWLIKSVAELDMYDRLPAVLRAARPASTQDMCSLAVPVMDCLHKKKDSRGTRLFIKYFAEHHPQENDETPYTLRKSWVSELLAHYWKQNKQFVDVKSVYALLQKGGMFTGNFFSAITQYSVLRQMILLALKAGDDVMAREEMRSLSKLRPEAVESDIWLRGQLVIRDALLGDWDAVRAQLMGLRIQAERDSYQDYQRVLSSLTKAYRKEHTPEQTDEFVRSLVENYGMILSKPIALLVLDRLARNLHIEDLLDWLHYCQESGLELDQLFFNEIVEKCCRYRKLGPAEFTQLLTGVRKFVPWIRDPHPTKYSIRGPLAEFFKSSTVNLEDGSEISATLPKKDSNSTSALDQSKVFNCMNVLALKGDWEQVHGTFQDALKQGLELPARCLRLAVIANIKLEGPNSRTADGLIASAYAKGQDVSVAMVPLLFAKMDAGGNIATLLQGALDKGCKIHDSVYNKAARMMLQENNIQAAIRLCELAATQNGEGDLVYSKFNFATLVIAYARQSLYAELEVLVLAFNAKSLYWHGAKQCKEAVKMAMKTVAARTAKRCEVEQKQHEEALYTLDSALEHVKECRAALQEDRLHGPEGLINAMKKTPREQTPKEDGGAEATRAAEQQPATIPELVVVGPEEDFHSKQRLAGALS